MTKASDLVYGILLSTIGIAVFLAYVWETVAFDFALICIAFLIFAVLMGIYHKLVEWERTR